MEIVDILWTITIVLSVMGIFMISGLIGYNMALRSSRKKYDKYIYRRKS